MTMTSNRPAAGVPPIAAAEGGFGDAPTASAVSWAAIVAGAVAMAATTLILLMLGAGIGLTMVSPWSGAGASAMTVGVSAIIWWVVVQWISSGLGGYLAGRLRTKWVRLHSHEVFFRDTAHGFLAWALATVIGVVVLASVAASGVSGLAGGTAATAAAGQAAGAQGGAAAGEGPGYIVDGLFRAPNPAEGDKGDFRAETTRILLADLHDGRIVLTPPDRGYIAAMIASRTGIPQPEAAQRVDSAVQQLNDDGQKLRAAADLARKRAAQLSIAAALSLLVGAFVASAAAAIGGSGRDDY